MEIEKMIGSIEFEEMKKQLDSYEQEAKSRGLPFNQKAYLRRMMAKKGKYYDSADYVLNHGWPEQQQCQTAYFKSVDNPDQQISTSNLQIQNEMLQSNDSFK
ncbi:Conserved_hypothetical protein [Hexamita inflata]|uniref:Uncharacterized protein n=1 Tax=Hexamita inflata TaxID=28002 RepID=A0AA86URF0_9EUKA|nr:Conserved hypothetical protein [Hexamita inflata]CAI9965154.1 Conserved hypothetical protein [Hexamita inflata]